MRVTLVGAGPGDPGLLTIRAAERIKNADVVLYDRFVSDEVLAMIPDTAEKIDVGKNAGNHPVPQDEINRLLLEKTRQGLEVVRLKGGDPFVFGRGGEELKLLAEEGIPFEVIPGITSAVAGPAYAGIPVTHRDYVSSFSIITGHGKNHEKPDINYDALVGTKGTLIFLMGVSEIEEICNGCIKAGMKTDIPAAIVESATLGAQRKILGTVGTLFELARRNEVSSPAVIIIGEVCSLSEKYDWFGRKPLLGKKVMVCRANSGESKLSARLRELGCQVVEMPGPKTTVLTGLDGVLEKIDEYTWLIFTSKTGVDVFFTQLIETGVDIRSLGHLKIACVGAETEKEVNRRGIKVRYRPDEYNGAALARGLTDLVKSGERILIARAKEGAEDLTKILTEAGIDFEDAAIYENIRSFDKMDFCGADAVLFTSSKAVEWFAQGVDFPLTTIKAVCIGERTAKSAGAYGMEVYVSDTATIDSMVIKVKELFADGK